MRSQEQEDNFNRTQLLSRLGRNPPKDERIEIQETLEDHPKDIPIVAKKLRRFK